MQSRIFSISAGRTASAFLGVLSLGALALPASAMDILARVISSTPVVQQWSVPRQVCENANFISPAPNPSGAGAVMGAIAGGAAGNAIGNGSGRALATMIGLVGGAIAGNRIEGNGGGNGFNNSQVQPVTQCTTQNFLENRLSHYNVVYEYQGRQSSIQMANDPGAYVRLQVTPVGSGFPQNQPVAVYNQPVDNPPVYVQPYESQPIRQGQIQHQTPQIRPQLHNQPPQVYYTPQQPVYIEQQRIYVHPHRGAMLIEPQLIVEPGGHIRRYYGPQQQHHWQRSGGGHLGIYFGR